MHNTQVTPPSPTLGYIVVLCEHIQARMAKTSFSALQPVHLTQAHTPYVHSTRIVTRARR